MKTIWSALMATALSFGVQAAQGTQDQVIEIKPSSFVASDLIPEKTLDEVRKSNVAKGFGDLDYEFSTDADGWWEFWVKGGGNPFDLVLDGRLVIHSPAPSGVWTEAKDGSQKMLNLRLQAGRHTLRLSKPEPWGIPWIGGMRLKKSSSLEGMVRVSPLRDCLAIRKGEGMAFKVLAGKGPEERVLKVSVFPDGAKDSIWSKDIEIPSGSGDFETELKLPDSKEGVFEARFTDSLGSPVDRNIQYLVVDVKDSPEMDREPKRELVQEIDVAKKAPDYASDVSAVVEAPFGAYRETGTKGRRGFNRNADWFAYKLELPSVQEPYLAEIEYPDDDERVVLLSLVERCPNPYAPTLGYASGGIYSLSNKMLVQQLYFYPRETDPRLFVQNWRTGMKAAIGKIKVYRLSSMPKAVDVPSKGRFFGGYQEENVRFTSYYGSTPDGNTWSNFFKAASRYGANQKFIGGNFWHQTIGNYQATLWPCKTIRGYGNECEGEWAVTGPRSLKDPVPQDIMRMQLLVCEKYGMGYVGDLLLSGCYNHMKYLDKLFGGKGTLDDNGPQKPWLIVSKLGECKKDDSPYKPYWNPFYPGVQDWAVSVFAEIANRYKDSPAFKGLSIRLGAWSFTSWQALPSIDWGYEDFTIALFEKETGVKVPVEASAPDRFMKRYEWLMANSCEKWVSWRCRKMFEYHSRLAKTLTDARPDLKLYIELPEGGQSAFTEIPESEWKSKGWTGVTRESGIDVRLYDANPSVAMMPGISYPSARARAWTQSEGSPVGQAFTRAQNWDLERIQASAQVSRSGSTSAVHLDGDSYEGEMVEGKALGYGENFKVRNNATIHGAGLVNPAGIHFLERFAELMAAGNHLVISDGSHGYDQQQPEYIRPFLAEYRALPPVPMKELEVDGDPVALWQGVDGGKMIFYIVNRLGSKVDCEVSFDGSAKVRRLSTGDKVKLDGFVLKLSLDPYQLLAFEGGADKLRVASLKSSAQASEIASLKRQIEFAASLASGAKPSEGPLNMTPGELKLAAKSAADAKSALEKGRLLTSRRLLLSPALTRLYEAFHSYPAGLLHRKAPIPPQGSLDAQALRNSALPKGVATQVCDASKIEPSLAGAMAFSWSEPSTEIGLQEHFANRFNLELAYVKSDSVSMPEIAVDGEALPSSAFSFEDGGSWGKASLRNAVSLGVGSHRIRFTKAKGSEAAIIYMKVEAAPRDIVSSDWMLLSPFNGSDDPRDKDDFNAKMAAQLPPEKSCDFQEKLKGLDGREISWARTQDSSDYVDFYKLTGEKSFRISYAVCDIESPSERDAEIIFGVDYWAKIWLGGKEVYSVLSGHEGPHKGEFRFPVRLSAGKNRLLVKLHAGANGNGFWMSISDPGDLKLSVN